MSGRPAGAHILLAALLATALAGCFGGDQGPAGDDVGDPCAWGVCPADPAASPEWTMPEGGTALWTFGDPYTSVSTLVATGSGWAWLARRDGQQRVESMHLDGALYSHALPPGHAVGHDRIVANAGAVWFTHARLPDGEPVLTRWDPEAGASEQWPLDGLNRRVAVTDAGPPVVLSAPSGTPATQVFLVAAGSDPLQMGSEPVPVGPEAPFTFAAALEGNTVLRADAVGHDTARTDLVMQDLVSGAEYRLASSNDTVVGVWSDAGRFAFAVAGSDGTVTLWSADTRALQVAPLAPGSHPVFVARGVYTWVEGPGVNPSVHFTPKGSAESSALVFPTSVLAWTASGPDLWWLDEPSTDPRFDEAPNPTPFAAALYSLRD